MPWPLDLPPYDPHDWWARRAAAWTASLLPPEIRTAVDILEIRPRGAARVVWQWTTTCLDARGRDLDTLSLSAVITHAQLAGLLPDDDIALLRALEVPTDTSTPRADLKRRLEELQEVGPRLPVQWPQ